MVAVIAGAIIYHQYRTHTIESLRSKLELCQTQKEQVAQALDKQNKRIDELVKEGRIQATKFEDLKTKIKSSQNTIDERINSILNEPIPQTCEGAIQYLLNTREELAWPE